MNFEEDQDSNTVSVSSRFAALVDLFASKKEASTVCGKSVDMLASYASGKRDAPFGVVSDLAIRKGVSLNWIATGVGQMLLDKAHAGDPRLDDEDVVAAAVLGTMRHLRTIKKDDDPPSDLVRILFLSELEEHAISAAAIDAEDSEAEKAEKELSEPVRD